jgi:hypothetical protein
LRFYILRSIAFASSESCIDHLIVCSENCKLRVEENNKISFILYPNPTRDVVNIYSKGLIVLVKIYSLLVQVLTENMNLQFGHFEIKLWNIFSRSNL